ncbi:hypothetical protein PRIPAC_95346, partial [Pristionchus pacificus]|uniref:Acetyltransferase n=1 Tax=Pristionchus pacificus TaxID=54126 RepID=A0A2A6D1S9_PRIPA
MPVRPATNDDIPDLFAMAMELAAFQQFDAAHVTISREHYAKDFQDGCFRAFVAIDEETGKTAGMVLCRDTYDCWKGKTMNQMVVRPEYRKKKLGKQLWAAVAEAAKEKAVAYLIWDVLDWNKPTRGFYESVAGVTEIKNDKGLLQYMMSREGIEQF